MKVLARMGMIARLLPTFFFDLVQRYGLTNICQTAFTFTFLKARSTSITFTAKNIVYTLECSRDRAFQRSV